MRTNGPAASADDSAADVDEAANRTERIFADTDVARCEPLESAAPAAFAAIRMLWPALRGAPLSRASFEHNVHRSRSSWPPESTVSDAGVEMLAERIAGFLGGVFPDFIERVPGLDEVARFEARMFSLSAVSARPRIPVSPRLRDDLLGLDRGRLFDLVCIPLLPYETFSSDFDVGGARRALLTEWVEPPLQVPRREIHLLLCRGAGDSIVELEIGPAMQRFVNGVESSFLVSELAVALGADRGLEVAELETSTLVEFILRLRIAGFFRFTLERPS